jgi:hypothetical protein
MVIENNILRLTIEEPGRIYKNSRFDWTGNISQILFENKFTFCSAETAGEFDFAMQGRGLFNEFGIVQPIGYEDCAPGETFPKIGVGLLTRPGHEPYSFLKAYQIDPFHVHIEKGGDWIQYTVLPRDCRGYAIKLIKKIALSGNSFFIDYVLENTGTRKIVTDEYCHNFIAVNGSDIDKDYTLRVPCEILGTSSMIEALNPENTVVLNTSSLSFKAAPRNDFFFSPLTEFHARQGEWEITHDRLGVGMKESTGFVPSLMNLWGRRHVISPELFIHIDLDPGKTMTWRRNYTFYHL